MNENQKKLNSQAEFVGQVCPTYTTIVKPLLVIAECLKGTAILSTMVKPLLVIADLFRFLDLLHAHRVSSLRTSSLSTQSVRYPNSFHSIRTQIRNRKTIKHYSTTMRFRVKHGMTRKVVGWAYLPNKGKQAAFTLAEVLITLAIIGIVAALTIPTLMNNYQEKAEREQVRMVKYKLTQATSLMNTEGLIGPYSSTEDFVKELQRFLKITKVCDNTNLRACWPSDTISVPTSEATFTTTNVNTIKTGTQLKSLGLGTAQTRTVGIVTNDGTSMIMTYSPLCTPLDMYRNYNYSFQDNKPVTNATTNCISAIFDINGSKGPNRIGKDVRTLNSLFGSIQLSATSVNKAKCEEMNSKGLLHEGCYNNTDYYAGAVNACHDLGLHLPDMQTLANIAGAKYGRTDIGPYTIIAKTGAGTSGDITYDNMCTDYPFGQRNNTKTNIICVDGTSIPNGANSSIASLSGSNFWSSSEVSSTNALRRYIHSNASYWHDGGRYNESGVPLCVGD